MKNIRSIWLVTYILISCGYLLMGLASPVHMFLVDEFDNIINSINATHYLNYSETIYHPSNESYKVDTYLLPFLSTLENILLKEIEVKRETEHRKFKRGLCQSLKSCNEQTLPKTKQFPYKPPDCMCFYDRYGILCRPHCKKTMVIKKWRTYLPVLPNCGNSCCTYQNTGLPIPC